MSKRKRKGFAASPKWPELPIAELTRIIERSKTAPLAEADYTKLKAAVDTLTFLTQEPSGEGDDDRSAAPDALRCDHGEDQPGRR